MERPTIFIGSSSEGRPTARAIKEQFDDEADVDVWDENVFQLNSSYLESLLRAASLYDFAILLFTPDDPARLREKCIILASAEDRHTRILAIGRLLGGPS
jgi:predicted nucleotide-binding protein